MKQISTTPNNVHQLRIYCHYHPKEILTEFCKNQECLQPLCRICMPLHIFDHFNHKTKASIHPIQEMIAEAYKKIAEIANSMVEYSEFLGQEIKITMDYLLPSNPLELLSRAESEVIAITRTYFSNLRTKLYSQSVELLSIENMKDIPNQLTIRWNSLMTELELLNTKEALSELIYYHQGDVQKSTFEYFHLTEEALNQLKSFQFNNIDLPQLNMNSEYLDSIWNSLKQFANFGQDNSEMVDQEEYQQIEYSEQAISQQNTQEMGQVQEYNGLQGYSEHDSLGNQNGIDHDSDYEGGGIQSRQGNEYQ